MKRILIPRLAAFGLMGAFVADIAPGPSPSKPAPGGCKKVSAAILLPPSR